MGIQAEKITKQSISDVAFGKSRILEMATDNSLINVPVDPRIDIDTITGDDTDPRFVNIEVIRAGISKTNNRRYNNNVVKEINGMVPGLQGFLGHPDPSKYGFEFRDPQTIYVGSLIDHMPDGIDRVIAKAYIFKSSPLREWIPKSIAAGNPMTVSINGTGDIMRNGDIIDVLHMSDLQSIDWANPGTEGMETSKAMSVVTEMQNDDNKGGNDMSEALDSKEILKNATVTEFKAFNPDGYNAMVKGITVTELQLANPSIVEQIKESGRITELQYNVGSEKKSVKVTEFQALVDGYENQITKLKDDAQKAVITEYKNSKIAELVPENLREKIGSRVSGETKEAIDKSLDAEIAYVREMGGMDNIPAPAQRQQGGMSSEDIMRDLFGVKAKENK